MIANSNIAVHLIQRAAAQDRALSVNCTIDFLP